MQRKAPYVGRVLIVEDDKDMAALLSSTLAYDGFHTDTVASLGEINERLAQFSYDAVLLDLCLGDENGLEAIPLISQKSPYSKIIVITAFGSVDLAVDAMERGATTFLTKSDDPRKIASELKARLNLKPDLGRASVNVAAEKLGIVGQSHPIREVMQQLEQIRDIDATVLILGESGTGKELIARAIHLLSSKAEHPFEAINCGAIPENLLESELFGYRRGAFTDAKLDKKGVFEVCSDGYLFLDEIGEVPPSLQVKLLRVLQEKEIKPLGSGHSLRIKTRVIAATNKDLTREVREGRFREDLYYRLSVVPIVLPPLRERREDIPLLVEYYLKKFNTRYKRQVALPSAEVMARLVAFDWPGNVRELQNAIERAVVLAKETEMDLRHIFHHNQVKQNAAEPDGIESVVYSDAKEKFERAFLRKILSVSRGNISEAARISGRFRSDIYRLMEKYGIHQQDYK